MWFVKAFSFKVINSVYAKSASQDGDTVKQEKIADTQLFSSSQTQFPDKFISYLANIYCYFCACNRAAG